MATFPTTGESFGPYQVTGRLGQGGMGVVFRAIQSGLNREVALKVLPPHHADVEEYRSRFTREAGLLAAMSSPHIIAIHDFGEHNGCLFIATQLVPGGDLATRLRDQGPLPMRDALRLVEQLASALSTAHRAGVVHRDVKPTNVLLGMRDNEIHGYLCDFGIARTDEDGITQTGALVGTFGYMAPERCNGAEATPASDIYSLGCLLVAAVTGNAPYAGTDLQVAQQHLGAPIPHWEETAPVLRAANALLRRSMAKAPEDRFSDAQEFRAEVLATLALLDPAAPAPPPPAHPADHDLTATVQRPVTPAAHPAPVATAPVAPAPVAPAPVATAASGARSRAPWFIGAGIGALTLALVGLLVVVLAGRGADDAGDRTAAVAGTNDEPGTETGSGSETDSGSEEPDNAPSTPALVHKRCWNGDTVTEPATCPAPSGRAGLRWVYPTLAVGYDCREPADPDKLFQRGCLIDVPGHEPVRMAFSWWPSVDAALNHYYSKYDGDGRRANGRIRWGPEVAVGSHQISIAYTDFPFSVSIIGTSDAQILAAERLLRSRTPAELAR